MENNFINTKRSLTNDDLKQFESKFNVVMPEKIKRHYLKYNGGYPERSIFHLEGSDREYAVNYFFSIGCNEGMTIEETWPIIRDDTVFPSWLVPLADEMGGDIFAYSTRADEEGAIYYYSHEFDYGENPEKYVTFLSKDIDTFLESLIPDDDE